MTSWHVLTFQRPDGQVIGTSTPTVGSPPLNQAACAV